MQLTAGAAYTGVIEQYDKVNGFILAQKPSSIRVIGQAPVVGTNIFDMVSDGETFQIFIPSKNQFLVGSAHLEHPSAKPQWKISGRSICLTRYSGNRFPKKFRCSSKKRTQQTAHYYVLTVAQRAGAENATPASPDWEIARKIWFDRSNLNVSEIQTYDPDGKMNSDIDYSAWSTTDPLPYPHEVSRVHRITEDYQLQIEITKVAMNEPVEASRCVLAQPPGSTLVRVGEDTTQMRPLEPKPREPKSLDPRSAEPRS